MEPGASFELKITKEQDATLITNHPTYREDIESEATFEEYTKRHYNSWVSFVRNKEYGDDVNPVLVSGVDTTEDFAMIAISDWHNAPPSFKLIALDPQISFGYYYGVWGAWDTNFIDSFKCGPFHTRPPPPEALEPHPSAEIQADATLPDSFNQCVFIRYYTMRSRPEPTVQMGMDSDDEVGDGEYSTVEDLDSAGRYDSTNLQLYRNFTVVICLSRL